jgi:hypothetical protein
MALHWKTVQSKVRQRIKELKHACIANDALELLLTDTPVEELRKVKNLIHSTIRDRSNL